MEKCRDYFMQCSKRNTTEKKHGNLWTGPSFWICSQSVNSDIMT